MSRCASEAFEHGPLPAEALSLAPPVSLIEHGPVRFPDGSGGSLQYLFGSLPPRSGPPARGNPTGAEGYDTLTRGTCVKSNSRRVKV